jgi:hypothetical protein
MTDKVVNSICWVQFTVSSMDVNCPLIEHLSTELALLHPFLSV